MLNKIIESLEKLQEVRGNKVYGKQIIAEATEMYNAGWEALEDGIVVTYRGNQVAVKNGNTMTMNLMEDFSIRDGKINGNIDHQVKVIEIADDKLNGFLAQAIITKYYTVKKA